MTKTEKGVSAMSKRSVRGMCRSGGARRAQKDTPAPLESIPIPAKYGNPKQSGLTYDAKPGPQDHPIDLN
jgi:hypothetical protein